jgi:membrane protein required for colicin V production
MTPADWVVIAVLAVSFFAGLAQGFFRSICGLGGLILGLAVAAWNYHHFAASLSRFIRIPAVADAVAFILIAVVVIVVAGFIGHLLAKAFKLIGLGWLDGLAGGVFGIVEGAVVLSILILICAAFFPQETHWIAEGQLSRQFVGATHFSTHITPSRLGDQILEGLNSWKKDAPKWLHPNQN